MSFLKKFLYNEKPMSAKDYKISKLLIIINAATLSCSQHFSGNNYFTGLLKYMGAGESLSNFILSLAPLAGLFLILVPYITTNLNYKKPFVTLLSFFEYLPLSIAFFLPLITGNTMLSVIIAAIFFAFHSITTQMKTPPFQELILSCVTGDEGGATSYFGFKDGVTNFVLVATYLSLGIITKYCVGEKEGLGYTIIGTIAIITWLISVIAQFGIKEPYNPRKETVKVNVFKMIRNLLRYKNYKPYFTFQFFFNLANYSISSLLSVMCVQRLGMKLEILSYFILFDFVFRSVFAVIFGKLADKIGTKPVLALGLLGYASHSALYFFMNTENAYLLYGISVLVSSVACGAYAAPSFVYMFRSLPQENTSSYIACHNILMLLIGTVISMLVAYFVDIAAGFSINVMGLNFSEMNLVFLFATIVFALDAVYLFRQKKN